MGDIGGDINLLFFFTILNIKVQSHFTFHIYITLFILKIYL